MSNETSPTPQPNTNDTWSKIENIVSIMGKWSWVLILIEILVSLAGVAYAFSLISMYGSLFWQYAGLYAFELIWFFIAIIIDLVIIVAYVIRVFAKKCGEKDWNFLVNDVFVFGSVRIPKMVFWWIILAIFTNFYGSLLGLIPTILIIFLGPEKVQWKKE